ncbi:NAD(P)-binding protein [Mesorhizobium sp.]|uniref:NAD(P)-binding protein n=1 Tax=Mesorhizobium sp. TaxID=1871066 RepID=UPI000FE9B335|nr:MAG: hypothetical protein EOR39_11840 [Mesorhizobium sp.]TIQ49671.1 MAG: hypothetical protein E5X47_12500 [Mesorhizobium sp.]TIQ59451.1 MAG: hypothetical protein E5X46_07180 [Mesorhizobium sp.]
MVGGGIAATSVAFHLARNGKKDVVIFERTTLPPARPGMGADRLAGNLHRAS